MASPRPPPDNTGCLMVVVGSLRRRWFVSKFAMTDSPTGVSDVSPASQSHCAEQDHRNSEWQRRFGPFDRCGDSDCAQSNQRIENPYKVLAPLSMLIEPCL